MRPRPALLPRLFAALSAVAALAACSPGTDAPLAPAAAPLAAVAVAGPTHATPPGATGTLVRWSDVLQPFRAELEGASAGLLYTSESDYPFDYVSRPLFLRDTLTLATFRLAFGVARTTPVDVRPLDRFFARHIELVDPNDPVSVALVPRYAALKLTIERLLRAPAAYCVGTIQLRCYVVGTSPQGVVAGLATTAIET